jgi:hypothetical protein
MTVIPKMLDKEEKMSKKYTITSEQLFDMKKPRYNGWGCGYGVHGKTKYSRKQKHKKDYLED